MSGRDRRQSLIGKKVTEATPYPILAEPVLQVQEGIIIQWLKDLLQGKDSQPCFSKDTKDSVKDWKDLYDITGDGVIQCELLNMIQPGIIKTVNVKAKVCIIFLFL